MFHSNFCFLSKNSNIVLKECDCFIYSGSTDALWFSSKFEKKMAAMDETFPGSPKFQRAVPLKQSKLITSKHPIHITK